MIGLGMMSFSTVILQIIRIYQAKPQTDQEEEGLGLAIILLAGIWGVGLGIWIHGLREISNIMRNNSLLGGLMAAHIAVGYVFFRVPSPTAEAYMAYTAWLAYAGMIIGIFM